MTIQHKAIVGAVLLAAMGAGVYETRQALAARAELEVLRERQGPLAEQIHQLQHERDAATRSIPALREEVRRLNHATQELLRLRAEVTRLRAAAGSTDAGGAGQSPQKIPAWQEASLKASSALWNESKLLLMKRRLNLTPEQTAAAEDIVKRRLEDREENAHTYQQQLKALLTPEQVELYTELTALRSRTWNHYAAVDEAAVEVVRLSVQFGLTSEQQEKAFAVLAPLYGASRQYRTVQSADGTSTEVEDRMPDTEVLLKRNAALENVLSSEQFAIYQRYTDRLLKSVQLRTAAAP